jgi:hypothetical protein
MHLMTEEKKSAEAHAGFNLQFSLIHIWILTIINLMIILGFFFVMPGKPEVTAPVAVLDREAETVGGVPDDDALNGFGQAVIRAGLPGCALPMNHLAERVLVGHKVGAYRFPNTQKGFGSLSMEVFTKNGATIYMSFNLAETGPSNCSIGYEAVSHWQNGCDEVAKEIFKDFIPTRNLGERLSLFTHKDNDNRKVFAMPVKDGCVISEKEVVNFSH